MIRCSHCGKLVPAGATSCQSCGMPLTAENEGGNMASQGQAGQPELPAWLESLRAHEKPVARGPEHQPFKIDELVDENSMPSWMSQDQSRLAETGGSDSMPAVSAGSNATPEQNLEASSLIDKQALPEWMREAQEGGEAAGQGFSASTLVQKEALPPWMKNLAQDESLTSSKAAEERYGLPATQPPPQAPIIVKKPQTPATPPPVRQEQPLAQGFQANALIDQQAMPEWMKGEPGASPQAQSRSAPPGSGFSAGELIDQRAVPNWMKDQQGQQGRASANPVSAKGVPVYGSGQETGTETGQSTGDSTGIPAATFVDQNTVPPWMSESQQAGTGTNASFEQGMSAGSLVDKSAMPNWMKAEGNAPQSANQQPGNGMPAGSLIDMNAVPPWIKNDGQSGPGVARNEGMRVPSRPRGYITPPEQSEAAANVFSSMLGVAASTPIVPGQTLAQGPQGTPPPPVRPTWQPPQSSPAYQAAPPVQPPLSPFPQEQRMGATPLPASPISNNMVAERPPVYGNMQPYPGYIAGAERNRTSSPLPPLGVGSAQQQEAEEPKKKSVFEAIRDFFFH